MKEKYIHIKPNDLPQHVIMWRAHHHGWLGWLFRGAQRTTSGQTCELQSLTHSPTHSLTHSLLGVRVLETITGIQLVKKFPEFYGTRRFITAFTSAHHLSLSWASSIQSIPPHPTPWRSILIYSYSIDHKGKIHPITGHVGPEGSRCIALLFLQLRR